jgi:small-conductance mechanosensitive channel
MSTAAAAMIDGAKPLDVQYGDATAKIEDLEGADRLTQRQAQSRNQQYAIQRELLRQIATHSRESLRVVWSMTLDHPDDNMRRMHKQVQETLSKIDSVWLSKKLAAAGTSAGQAKQEERAA